MALEHCLLLVRHGESAWNAEDRMATSTDVPLSQHGREQGLMLAASLHGAVFDTASSSPLSRALVTAEIGLEEATIVDPVIHVDERLIEPAAGVFEGHTFTELRTLAPLAEQYRAYSDEANPIYPPGAEHHDLTVARGLSFLTGIEAQRGRHVAFSHGSLMRILVSAFIGSNPCCYRRLKVDNCHGILINFYPQPPHQLLGINLPPVRG